MILNIRSSLKARGREREKCRPAALDDDAAHTLEICAVRSRTYVVVFFLANLQTPD